MKYALFFLLLACACSPRPVKKAVTNSWDYMFSYFDTCSMNGMDVSISWDRQKIMVLRFKNNKLDTTWYDLPAKK